MKKRILSILLACMMCISMLPTVALAAGNLDVKVTASTTNPSAGDTVTFTVSIGAVTKLQSMEFVIDVPAGMTYVASSAKLQDGLKDTLNVASADWTELTQKFTMYGDGEYTSSADTTIMTFDCSVDDSANGTLSVSVKAFSAADSDYEEIAANLIPASVTIAAAPVAVTGVELNKTSTSITVGKTETLTATVSPADATNKAVTWTSSDASVASVADGVVTAHKVGTATITVTTVDGSKTATCDVTVTAKPAQTITADNVTAAYGDSGKKVTATTDGDGAISYAVKSGSEDYIAVAADGTLTIKKVGEAYVTVTAAETENYAAATKDVKVTISPKSITPEVTANVPSEGYTYDGSAKTPGVTVKNGDTILVQDQDYTVSYADHINAGTNTAKVTVSAKAGGNYTWTAVEKPFSIGKADQTISGGNFSATVGSTVDLSKKFSAQGALSYEITGANTTGSSVSGNTLTVGSTAGFFDLKVSAAATGNYNAAEKTIAVTVSEKVAQTITAADVAATYGDSGKKVSASTDGDGAISYAVKSGSEDYIAVAADGTLTIKKAGTAYVTVTAAETSTYAKATKDVKLTIAPKTITAPTADTKTYTYNGKAQIYGVTGTADYTVTGGTQTNAGTHTVTVALKDKVNTVWADTKDTVDKEFSFVIKKATITITAKNKTAYVGDTAPELGASDYTVSSLAEGEALKTAPTIAYALTPDMTKEGTFPITVSGAEAPDGGNYEEIAYVNGTLSIITKSSGSSSDGGTATYAITVESAKNGTVTSSAKNAAKGTTVTLTVKPDAGYELEELTVVNKNGTAVKLTEKNGKYTFTMPASKVTVKAAFAAIEVEPVNPFEDVADDAYYNDAVIWAVEKGITDGITATSFAPNAACTRAQAVTFLWRTAGCPAPKSTEMPFADVAESSYYYNAVLWAVENGITNGTSATTFSPNADCTRAHIVTFLWRAQGCPAAGAVNPFTDVAADAYYNSAVLWAVEQKITDGTSATTFSPDNNCTRAQIVTFLYRCAK